MLGRLDRWKRVCNGYMITGLVIGILIHCHESDLKNEEQVNTDYDTITHEVTVFYNTQKVKNHTYDLNN